MGQCEGVVRGGELADPAELDRPVARMAGIKYMRCYFAVPHICWVGYSSFSQSWTLGLLYVVEEGEGCVASTEVIMGRSFPSVGYGNPAVSRIHSRS